MSSVTARYGDLRAGTGTPYGAPFDSNQSAPTLKVQARKFTRFDEAQWSINLPDGCTSYHAHFLRWIDAAGEFREDEEVTSTAPLTYYQFSAGQPLAVYIDNIAGMLTGDFQIVSTGINKAGG